MGDTYSEKTGQSSSVNDANLFGHCRKVNLYALIAEVSVFDSLWLINQLEHDLNIHFIHWSIFEVNSSSCNVRFSFVCYIVSKQSKWGFWIRAAQLIEIAIW